MNQAPIVTLYAGFTGEHMDKVNEAVLEHLARAGIEGPSAYVMQTVVDELLCNVLEHGSALWIEMELRPEGRKVRLVMRDNGPAFDPMPAICSSLPQQEGEAPAPRNMGLFMVGQLAREWVYHRLEVGVNQLTMAVELSPEDGVRWSEHSGVRLLIMVADETGEKAEALQGVQRRRS